MLDTLFPGLNDDEKKTFASYLQRLSVNKGTVLIEAGGDKRDMYLIDSGACEIYKMFSLGSQIYALKVATLNGPIILGEANMFLGTKRQASVVISSDELTALKLSREGFDKLKEEHPALAIKIMETVTATVCERMYGAFEAIQNRMISENDMPQTGLVHMRKYLGDIHQCTRELAEKLFKLEKNNSLVPETETDEEEVT